MLRIVAWIDIILSFYNRKRSLILAKIPRISLTVTGDLETQYGENSNNYSKK